MNIFFYSDYIFWTTRPVFPKLSEEFKIYGFLQQAIEDKNLVFSEITGSAILFF